MATVVLWPVWVYDNMEGKIVDKERITFDIWHNIIVVILSMVAMLIQL